MTERKSSQARIDANKKYADKTYKRYAVNTRLEFVPLINQYKQTQKIDSDSGIFNAAIKYCIDNNIDLNAENEE